MWELEDGQLEKKDDIRLKSKITQAIKLFSEGKNLIDVVIADEVQEIYRQFLKLKDMHELVGVYDEMQSS
jgi:superfamily I DNA and RNA helicase